MEGESDMAVLKCKMCGGDLEIQQGTTIAECEYCGTPQTIPSLDNEKKMLQFERAERLRKNCEFDKAAGVYETIVSEFTDEAEAYWGLVLCKYGIEYVDDPATKKKVPTCHRTSFDSVMDDSNYERVVRLAPTRESIDKIYRMRDYFTTYAERYDYVPDPYYEGREGFYLVIEMLEEACEKLLDEMA